MVAHIISFCIQLLVAAAGCIVAMLYTARTINIVQIYKLIRCKEATEENLHAYKECKGDLICSCGAAFIGLAIIAIACVGDTTALFAELLY